MTSPRMRSRAVRTSAARVTFCGSAGSIPSSTVNSPVGCSTEIGFTSPGGTCATPCVTEPSSTQAVPTVTAASTPIASWHTCGMKQRVATAPPARGGAIRHIFGYVLLVTSPSPIARAAFRRSASTRTLSAASAFISATLS